MTDAPTVKSCPYCANPMEWWGDDMIRHAEPINRKCPLAIMAFTDIEAWNTRSTDPDLDAHIGAVLAAAAQIFREACVARYTALARHGEVPSAQITILADMDQQDFITRLRPDAMQALERVRREAFEEGKAQGDYHEGLEEGIGIGRLKGLDEASAALRDTSFRPAARIIDAMIADEAVSLIAAEERASGEGEP